MKHFLLLLSLLILIFSLDSHSFYTEGHSASVPIGPEYPVANVKKVFTVKITSTNYSPEQKAKLDKAAEAIAKIFNSPEFKAQVLARKYTSTKLSPPEIYEAIFRGAEALQPAVNYQMDLKVEMYFKRFTKVVGYTTPKSLIVYTNSKFHSYYSHCEIASNLSHEWMHKLGFAHSSASDSKSVPYTINEIIEQLCSKY